MTLLNLFLRLLFAHVLMDFVLQPNKMVSNKKSMVKKTRIKANLLHSFLHAMVAYIMVAEWEWWYIPVVIFVSHFAIDYWYKKDKDGLVPFIVDQALHLFIILMLSICTTVGIKIWTEGMTFALESDSVWSVIIAYLLVTQPASVLIAKFIKKWEPIAKEKSNANLTKEETGMEQAGRWIGYLERILILTFILVNQWAAIGFLLAAKSIFRYGDLKENREVRLTEYVLIGTLSSFVIAIITGLIVRAL